MSEYEGGIVDQVEEWFEDGTDGGEFPSDDGSAYDCGGIIEPLEETPEFDWVTIADEHPEWSPGPEGGEIPTVWVDEQGNEIPAPVDGGDGADWTEGLSMGLGPEDGEKGEYFN